MRARAGAAFQARANLVSPVAKLYHWRLRGRRIRVPSHLPLPAGVPRRHLLQRETALRQTAECLAPYE